jgi:hypothetical protein
MTGEIMREVAVLVGVFVLLDVGIASWEGALSLSISQTIVLTVSDLLGSALLAFGGMILERWR